MRRISAVLALAAALAGCSKTVRESSSPMLVTGKHATKGKFPRNESGPTATKSAFERHVANAIDAGEGDFDAARLRKALAADPRNLEARLALASHYGQAGLPDLELEHYRLAAQMFPASAAAHIRLAGSLRKAGELAEARRTLLEFEKRGEVLTAEGHSWLGILLDEDGDLAAAERSHRKALELDRGRAAFHNNLGYNLLLQGRRSDAAMALRRAVELDPKSTTARNNLGFAVDGEESLEQWRAAGGASSAHNNKAAMLISEKRYEEARRELNLALGYNPGNEAAMRNLSLVSELDGKPAVIERRETPTVWHRLAGWVAKVFSPQSKS